VNALLAAQSPVLTPLQLSELIHRSPETLREWRPQRRGPRYIKIDGAAVVYRRDDVAKWLDAFTCTPTAAAAD
jgi:hypothetical protein